MLGHTKSFLVSAIVLGASLPVSSFSLSSSCSASLQGLIRNEAAACLNGGALFTSILGVTQGSDVKDISAAIPNIMDSWLGKLCTSGSCTNENIETITKNLTGGCASDLEALGFGIAGKEIDVSSTGLQGDIVSVVQKVYPVVREVACLKEFAGWGTDEFRSNSANQFCAVQTVSSVEKAIGGLTFDDISFLSITFDAVKLIATGAKSLACTNCIKSAFNLARNAFPDIVSEADNELGGFCGASFVDGSSPDGITQSAQAGVFAAPAPKNNGAVASSGFGKAGVVLGVVFSAFVFMA
ncbi:hypothetical protein V5O48_006904 [Marasmius crinis-equi]|uniref:Uncharacterized protein n=1 Tax=Marasmius crinis-equi TaxID=585013 RepID=A0ABR3FI88_9AGAR